MSRPLEACCGRLARVTLCSMKNPWLAAFLNFALFGGGTFYIGKRRLFGALMTVGGTAAQVVEISVSPAGSNAIPELWPFLLGGLVVMKLTLAADGYREAREHNAAEGAASASSRGAMRAIA